MFNYNNKFYFLDATAINKGIIIINDIKTDGLKSQYKTPNENTNIQNSFFKKNFI